MSYGDKYAVKTVIYSISQLFLLYKNEHLVNAQPKEQLLRYTIVQMASKSLTKLTGRCSKKAEVLHI